MSLPDTIQAVVTGENQTASVQTIPFGTSEQVKNLAPHEVVVRIRAVGLNPTDWKHAFADWGGPGLVSGCDGAGDVVKVGADIKHIKVGDRVAGFTYGTSQPDNGSFAEYVRYDYATVTKLPDGASYEEGASLPVPEYTAVQALYTRLNLPKPSNPSTKREIILVWGGSTATGHSMIQLARASGLRVFATASPAAHAAIKEIGAEAVFDYKDPEIVQKIKAAAGEKGISYGVDTVAEHGSADKVVDSIGPSGGSVVVLLPVPEETAKRRSDVRVTFTILYSILGYEFTFAHAVHHPASPEHRKDLAEWLVNEQPAILEGWKKGEGSPKFRPQRLRSIDGGLEGVIKGMRIMEKGEYGREKIVITIA